MKRLLALLCVILLCGCGSESGVTPKLTGIKGVAEVRYFNEQFECAFSSTSNDEITVTVLSPEHLKEMTFQYKNEKLTAKYKGLEYTPNIDAMPSFSVIKAIVGVLEDSKTKSLERKSKDENYFTEGKIGDVCYTLYFSPARLPLSAKIPDESYTITFKNITVEQ